MLRLTLDELKQLLADIAEAMRERYSYLKDEVVQPEGAAPASPIELQELERHWGFALPASYRMLLSLHNGMRRFAYKAPLLSTHEIIAANTDWEVVDELDPDLVRSVFAGDPDYDLFFAFDFRKPPIEDELEVVIFTADGAQERHPTLVAFLQSYLNALKAAIEGEKADRDGLR